MDQITLKILHSGGEFKLSFPENHLQQIKDYIEEINNGTRTHFGYVAEDGDEYNFHKDLINKSIIIFQFPRQIKVF